MASCLQLLRSLQFCATACSVGAACCRRPVAPCGVHLGKQLRRDAAVFGREAGETAPARAAGPLRPTYVLLRHLPSKQSLFHTSSQAHWMQSWSVIRGKGKSIPSGGTLIIGREQVSLSLVLCWLVSCLRMYSGWHAALHEVSQVPELCVALWCRTTKSFELAAGLCWRLLRLRARRCWQHRCQEGSGVWCSGQSSLISRWQCPHCSSCWLMASTSAIGELAPA